MRSYEASVSAVLLDQRLRAILGLFDYDYTNLQVVELAGGVATTSTSGKATAVSRRSAPVEGDFMFT